MVAWICSSDRHPPTQAGTKTLFKAVKAFEKRESCDEAAKAGGANVDCGFPMISQIFWSCFCHLWNLFLFVLLNGFWRCLHLSWETIWEILEKNRVVFFFNAAEPLDDWELMSRDSWECGEDSWWREPSQGGGGRLHWNWVHQAVHPKQWCGCGKKGLGSWRIFQIFPTFCWRLEEINIQHVESMTKSELCFRRYCLFTSLRFFFFQFRFAKRSFAPA